MLYFWYKRFSSQPHQPFFTSGILFFSLFMILFILSYSNILILDSSVLTYHAYSMIFVVFLQFFLGFLFVVFPKFLGQVEISKTLYMKHFFSYFFLFNLYFIKFNFLFKNRFYISNFTSNYSDF